MAYAGGTIKWETNDDSDFSTSTWKLVARDLKVVDIHYGLQSDYLISETTRTISRKGDTRLRQKIDRKTLDGVDMNSMIWRIFVSTIVEAAVHLGTDYLQNSQAITNHLDRTIQQLFYVCLTLIQNQTEIQGLIRTDCSPRPWQKTTLLCDRAVRYSTAKVYRFSDSAFGIHHIADSLTMSEYDARYLM